MESADIRIRADGWTPLASTAGQTYDAEAAVSPQRYKIARGLQNGIVTHICSRAGVRPVVLDFGCGTARDAQPVLEAFPAAHYVGIDVSNAMLAHAAAKIQASGLTTRVTLIHEDIINVDRGFLIRTCDEAGVEFRPACVLLSMILHHYGFEFRRRLYAHTLAYLPQSAPLIITDLWDDFLPYCSKSNLELEVDDIKKATANLSDDIAPETFNEIHYRFHNRPIRLLDEIDLLRAAGCQRVDICYRHGQLGVLVAR